MPIADREPRDVAREQRWISRRAGMGIDPIELRRRNMIHVEDLP